MNKFFKVKKKQLRITNKDIERALNVSAPTALLYMRRPHMMRYGQLQVMAKLFKVEVTEMLRLAEESEALQKRHNAEMEKLINKK